MRNAHDGGGAAGDRGVERAERDECRKVASFSRLARHRSRMADDRHTDRDRHRDRCGVGDEHRDCADDQHVDEHQPVRAAADAAHGQESKRKPVREAVLLDGVSHQHGPHDPEEDRLPVQPHRRHDVHDAGGREDEERQHRRHRPGNRLRHPPDDRADERREDDTSFVGEVDGKGHRDRERDGT